MLKAPIISENSKEITGLYISLIVPGLIFIVYVSPSPRSDTSTESPSIVPPLMELTIGSTIVI